MSIEVRIRELVAEHLELDDDEVVDGAFLADDFGADPYDLEVLAELLSEEFEVEIAEDEVEGWETLADVIQTVNERIEED
ncbi:MAG: phosphopantetheine-binding protein [Candidatus Alcyoniella australis]|nr:phosphopantetheine-binding protein [Candidatus Alcyoniella australis]